MGFLKRLKSKGRSQEDDRPALYSPSSHADYPTRYTIDREPVSNKNSLKRTGSIVGATISRVRSNGHGHARNAPLPVKYGGDLRPTGLFTDVKPPLLGAAPRLDNSNSPRRKRSDGSTSEKSIYPLLEGERSRRRAPNDDKANRVLGRDPDPAIWYNKKMYDMQPKSDINRSWSAVAPRSASVDAGRKQKSYRAHRRPSAFELPGTFPNICEKQALWSSNSSLLTSDDHEVDSAIELPTEHNMTRSSSMSFAAELEGSEISTPPPVELPGSLPQVAEIDAGPLPLCELPGSFRYDEKREPAPSLYFSAPSRRSHIIAQKMSMPVMTMASSGPRSIY